MRFQDGVIDRGERPRRVDLAVFEARERPVEVRENHLVAETAGFARLVEETVHSVVIAVDQNDLRIDLLALGDRRERPNGVVARVVDQNAVGFRVVKHPVAAFETNALERARVDAGLFRRVENDDFLPARVRSVGVRVNGVNEAVAEVAEPNDAVFVDRETVRAGVVAATELK